MYARILVPVDGSAASEAGLVEAVRLSRLTGGTLRLLHVLEDVPYVGEAAAYGRWPSDRQQAALDAGHALLERCASLVVELGGRAETTLVEAIGHPLQHYVAEQVDAWPADLVVLGTHGRHGLERFIVGSDAEQIVRRSAVPVLLVRHADAAGERTEAAGARVAAPSA